MSNEYYIKLDYRCNNNCIFCMTGDESGFLSLDETKKIVDEIDKSQFDIVTISGGEPTLNKDLIDILNYIKSKNFEICLQTNARTFRDDNYAQIISEIGIEKYLISFHGYNQKVFDIITQRENSFVETIEGIRNIKKYNQYVIINTVVNKLNYEHLKDIAMLAKDMNVDEIKYVFLREQGNCKKKYQELCPRFSDINHYLLQALEFAQNNNMNILMEGIPFCQAGNYCNYIGELYVPTIVDFSSKGKNIKDINSDVYYSKSEKCTACNYNEICCGTWNEYLHLYGDYDLQPIKNTSPIDTIDLNILNAKIFR